MHFRVSKLDQFCEKFASNKAFRFEFRPRCTNVEYKTPKIIDFRSDTLSSPSEGMRKAMCNAQVGDDVFSEDPTVNALEARCAQLFHKEAACFVSSGTMANLISVLVHCDERGSEIITGHLSHINLYEQRGVSQFGGVSVREIHNKEDGTFDIKELNSYVRSARLHEPTTKLICAENTHNARGGAVLPLEWIDQLVDFAKSKTIKLHMDGARIFNAALQLNVPVARITRDFDSTTFCFSKGLGAPYGSMMVGSTEFIERARRIRKGLGGGTRQAGFMAAAAMYALDNLDHLKDDHENIQKIANAIREIQNPHVTVRNVEDIHSNILLVYLDTNKVTSERFIDKLNKVSENDENPVIIKVLSFGEDRIRLVACCNNTASDTETAIVKIKNVINEFK